MSSIDLTAEDIARCEAKYGYHLTTATEFDAAARKNYYKIKTAEYQLRKLNVFSETWDEYEEFIEGLLREQCWLEQYGYEARRKGNNNNFI